MNNRDLLNLKIAYDVEQMRETQEKALKLEWHARAQQEKNNNANSAANVALKFELHLRYISEEICTISDQMLNAPVDALSDGGKNPISANLTHISDVHGVNLASNADLDSAVLALQVACYNIIDKHKRALRQNAAAGDFLYQEIVDRLDRNLRRLASHLKFLELFSATRFLATVFGLSRLGQTQLNMANPNSYIGSPTIAGGHLQNQLSLADANSSSSIAVLRNRTNFLFAHLRLTLNLIRAAGGSTSRRSIKPYFTCFRFTVNLPEKLHQELSKVVADSPSPIGFELITSWYTTILDWLDSSLVRNITAPISAKMLYGCLIKIDKIGASTGIAASTDAVDIARLSAPSGISIFVQPQPHERACFSDLFSDSENGGKGDWDLSAATDREMLPQYSLASAIGLGSVDLSTLGRSELISIVEWAGLQPRDGIKYDTLKTLVTQIVCSRLITLSQLKGAITLAPDDQQEAFEEVLKILDSAASSIDHYSSPETSDPITLFNERTSTASVPNVDVTAPQSQFSAAPVTRSDTQSARTFETNDAETPLLDTENDTLTSATANTPMRTPEDASPPHFSSPPSKLPPLANAEDVTPGGLLEASDLQETAPGDEESPFAANQNDVIANMDRQGFVGARPVGEDYLIELDEKKEFATEELLEMAELFKASGQYHLAVYVLRKIVPNPKAMLASVLAAREASNQALRGKKSQWLFIWVALCLLLTVAIIPLGAIPGNPIHEMLYLLDIDITEHLLLLTGAALFFLLLFIMFVVPVIVREVIRTINVMRNNASYPPHLFSWMYKTCTLCGFCRPPWGVCHFCNLSGARQDHAKVTPNALLGRLGVCVAGLLVLISLFNFLPSRSGQSISSGGKISQSVASLPIPETDSSHTNEAVERNALGLNSNPESVNNKDRGGAKSLMSSAVSNKAARIVTALSAKREWTLKELGPIMDDIIEWVEDDVVPLGVAAASQQNPVTQRDIDRVLTNVFEAMMRVKLTGDISSEKASKLASKFTLMGGMLGAAKQVLTSRHSTKADLDFLMECIESAKNGKATPTVQQTLH